MERFDHVATTSNGSGRESVRYRETLKALVIAGRWRDAMAMEILDVRQVAREAGEARRYNEALSEMLAYFKCLDAHGLLG
jgi:hypothetical protein